MNPRCPHCGEPLQAFSVPDEGGWDSSFHIACFNDDCSYFLRGRVRMEETYGVKASYRYRIDPANGHASPLGVWSRDALRDRILDAEITAAAEPPAAVAKGA